MKRSFRRNLRFIEKGDRGDIQFEKRPKISKYFLFFLFLFAMGGFFVVLILRLFQLTVVKGSYYQRLSEENRIREIVIEPKRGSIVDRKGMVLAENRDGTIGSGSGRVVSKRIYLSKEDTAHLIGYRQIADEEGMKNDNCISKLRLGDKIGKKGIEKEYDCLLRGIPGKKMIEVDARGTYLRTVGVVQPTNGETIQLALDLELQQKAMSLIKGKRAVVIATKPTTGEILVFASSPSFDPQQFEDGDNSVYRYFEDPSKPMFNRITEGTYPPGSIFKLIVAGGGLEEKAINEKTTFEDTGKIQAGPITFGNWYFLQYGKTEGQVDLVKALKRSNDIYFYKAGEALGPEKIKKWSELFGLGKKTDIGFEESEGTLPSPFWKEEVLKEKWYLGDTYNYSIGQGYLLTSPLQMNQAAAVYANKGYLCKPNLLKNETPKCSHLPLSEKTITLVREGMSLACKDGGTGWPLFGFKAKKTGLIQEKLKGLEGQKKASMEAQILRDPQYWQPIDLGCKTGTAESHATSGISHAWFSVFAPFENPEIQVTVLVEEGGQGSDVASPIARDVLKTYFERNE